MVLIHGQGASCLEDATSLRPRVVTPRNRSKGSNATHETSCAMPALTPRTRTGPAIKRPPHIVGLAGASASGAAGGEFEGLMAAPPLPSSADVDDVDAQLKNPWVQPAHQSSKTGQKHWSLKPMTPSTAMNTNEVGCEAGCGQAGRPASRPDTCYLTHTFMKQEFAYLARRVDEVARYFLVLEQLIGTGSLGPILEKTLHDFERHAAIVDTMEDVDEIQTLVDAAVRLGLNSKRYAPLIQRKEWLLRGKRRCDLQEELMQVDCIHDTVKLQQLIDDCVRHDISSKEIEVARQRKRHLELQHVNEMMISAAAEGRTSVVAAAFRQGADCNYRRSDDGASLWHLVASSGDAEMARLAAYYDAPTNLLDHVGYTPLMWSVRRQDISAIKGLMDAGASLSIGSRSSEFTLNCGESDHMARITRAFGADRRLIYPLGRSTRDGEHRAGDEIDKASDDFDALFNSLPIGLDIGDELLTGRDAQSLTVRRVGKRTPLHIAVLRASTKSDKTLVEILRFLLLRISQVDLYDDLERTPLWYAAYNGNCLAVQMLIDAGATVSKNPDLSPLAAAASKHTMFFKAGDHGKASTFETLCRFLLKHGGTYDEKYAAFSEEFHEACGSARHRSQAFEDAGGVLAIETYSNLSSSLTSKYTGRLLAQRGQDLNGFEDVMRYSREAMPSLESLVFELAEWTGAEVSLDVPPTTSRVRRLARSQGVYAEGSETDWHRIVGAASCKLVFHDVPSLYKGMAIIEDRCGLHIRSFVDTLIHEDDSERRRSSVSDIKRAAVKFYGVSRREVHILMEIAGVICLLRLTVARIAEAEQEQLALGLWLRKELFASIQAGSIDLMEEALEYAAQNIDPFQVGRVLNMTMANGSTAVCAAVSQTKILKALLDSHASPNGVNAEGKFALTVALEMSSMSCFTLLLRSGADPSKIPNDYFNGLTDADVFLDDSVGLKEDHHEKQAIKFKQDAKLLLEQARQQRELDTIALVHEVERFSTTMLSSIQHLLRCSADANAITKSSPMGEPLTLLSCAVAHESNPLVVALLKHGALVQRMGGHRSALHLAKNNKNVYKMVFRQATDELQLAVKNASVSEVLALLDAGVNPEEEIIRGSVRGPLINWAIELPPETGLVLVEDLLRRGVHIESRDPQGRTPLLAALAHPNTSPTIVAKLLEHNANVDARDDKGCSAVMLAASSGSFVNLESLLNAGAPGAHTDNNGFDAAFMAFKALHVDCLKLLQEHGYSLNRHWTVAALFSAIEEGTKRAHELLDLAVAQFPSISLAAEDCHEAEPRPLVQTLLMQAVRSRNVKIVKALLRYGAPLHPRLAKQSMGDVAEMRAAFAERTALAKPDATSHTERRRSAGFARALSIAATDCDTDSAWALASPELQKILRTGFAKEFLEVASKCDIMAAANFRQEEQHGLVITAKELELLDPDGFNALDHYIVHGMAELEIWLIERGGRLCGAAKLAKTLVEPIKSSDIDTVRRRLAAGAHVSVQDDRGRNPLDWCVISGSINGIAWNIVEAAIIEKEEPQKESRQKRLAERKASIQGARHRSEDKSSRRASRSLYNFSGANQRSSSSFRGSSRASTMCTDVLGRGSASELDLGQASIGTFASDEEMSLGTLNTEGLTMEDSNLLFDNQSVIVSRSCSPLASSNSPLASPRASPPHSGRNSPRTSTSKRQVNFSDKPRHRNQHKQSGRNAERISVLMGEDFTVNTDGLTSRVVGHVRKTQKVIKPDPRGTFGAIEEVLLETGARFEFVRSALSCLKDPLQSRDVDTVRRRLKAGADPGVFAEKGLSLAHFALNMRLSGAACELIRAGAPVNTRDAKGCTILWRAIEYNDYELINACLEHGADVKLGITTSNESSVVHLALEIGQPDLAIRLLNHDKTASVQLVHKLDTHGRPVVWKALEQNYPQLVRECFRHGADATVIESRTGRNMIHAALDAKLQDLLRELIRRGASVIKADKLGNTPLKLAVTQGNKEAMDVLIEAGATPQNMFGDEVFIALEAGEHELARYLIDLCPASFDDNPVRQRQSTGLGGRSASSGSPASRRLSNSDNSESPKAARRSSKWKTIEKKLKMAECVVSGMLSEGKKEDHAAFQRSTFALAADLHAKDVCTAIFAKMLVAAGMYEQEEIDHLTNEICVWIFEAPGEEKTRAYCIEALPSIIFEDGPKSSALDLLKIGLPYSIVETLSHVHVEGWDSRVVSRNHRSQSKIRGDGHASSSSPTGKDVEPTHSRRNKRQGTGVLDPSDGANGFKQVGRRRSHRPVVGSTNDLDLVFDGGAKDDSENSGRRVSSQPSSLRKTHMGLTGWTCSCGHKLDSDARFCNQCGKGRSTMNGGSEFDRLESEGSDGQKKRRRGSVLRSRTARTLGPTDANSTEDGEADLSRSPAARSSFMSSAGVRAPHPPQTPRKKIMTQAEEACSCETCGNKLEADATFCRECGGKGRT